MKSNDTILSIQDLNVQFQTPEGQVSAVNDFSVDIKRGETLGIVGESGSGKTQSFLGIMGLLAANGSSSGKAIYNDVNLLELSAVKLDEFRGKDITMIFQDPMTSLNPFLTIGLQLNEILIKHKKITDKQATEISVDMLNQLSIPEARKRLKQYPHELSGGMRQRIMISMAMLCDPSILIADEPTTALDVTIQAQILDLINLLKKTHNTSIIFITHDLGVVAGICDKVAVMYGGRIVEYGKVDDIFYKPAHPYTKDLLRAIPKLTHAKDKLENIKGYPPNLQNLPTGCTYHPRCKSAFSDCKLSAPKLEKVGEDHYKACFLKHESKN